MNGAITNGNLDIVKFLLENRTEGCSSVTLWIVLLKMFLHENRTEGCTTYAMDEAATQGHLSFFMKIEMKDVLIQHLTLYRKFLLFNRTATRYSKIVESAAKYGQSDFIKYIHENQSEIFPSCVLDLAATNGQFE
ncbi:hypothetical protein THRCLA_20213 [Thraustotheca clavata]|uniref:Uncharacterized protein n=1 Tax=Thraustotheca clavata TaxID=74557 RepID=A0A1W0AAC7_9STRA|nr:hypothetical protein THRCLA_20213 [Thraustotheca clavata]